MHVLHHTSVKVVEEEWKVNPLWIRFFISPAVYIFHPIPPFPRLSALWFFSFCWKSWLYCSQWVLQVSVCAVHCSPLPQYDEKSLKKTMSEGRVRPLCSLFHLFFLSFFVSSDDRWCSLKTNCRCAPFSTEANCTLILVHTHTYRKMWVRTQTRTCLHIYIKALARSYTVHHGNDTWRQMYANKVCNVYSKTWKHC